MVATPPGNLPEPVVPPERDVTVPYTDADWDLDDITMERLTEAVPENTRLAYRRVAASFTEWCAEHDRVPMPATAATLTAYVSAMITAEYMPAAISQHIGAIRKMHAVGGHDDQPGAEDALTLLRGYRRKRAENGEHDREAPPLLRDELHACVAALDLDTLAGRRDQLLLVLGFTMMARRSELAALTLDDVTETADGIEVIVRTSKTDKESRGEPVAIPHGSLPEVDAVRLVRAWRASLAEHGITSGPLLRGVTRHDTPLPGGITPRTVNAVVQRAARAAELPNAERYSAHSLRAGGLTAALKAGIPLGVATKHGRWSPKSPVVIKYARAVDRWRDNAMRGVL